MSKMESAQMAVVRFTESDVIVASNILRLNGFNDTDHKNGTMTFNGVSYTNEGASASGEPINALKIALAEADPNYGNVIQSLGGGTTTIDDLFEADWGETIYVEASNGAYYWDSTGSIWRHQ